AGKLDLESRVISDGRFEVKGPFAKPWLPKGFDYESVSAGGRFAGPLTNLTYSGEFRVTHAMIPGLNPTELRGLWEGEGFRATRLELNVEAGGTQLFVKSAIEQAQDGLNVLLENMALTTNAQTVFALSNPCRVSVTQSGPGWTLAIPSLELKGQSELNVD